MQFAASSVALSPTGWEDQLGVFAEAGVRLVEFNSAFGPECREIATFDYTDPHAVERAGAALRDAGLELRSIHGPIRLAGTGRLAGPLVADAAVDAVVESLRACIDACAAMGGSVVVTQDLGEELPTTPGGRGRSPDRPALASRRALLQLADYAAAHGCVFAIENGAEDAQGFARLVRNVRELDHPGLGICLDFGHAQVWNHRDVPRAVREAGSWLRSCHVHDNLGMSDEHLPPGGGIIPWAAALDELAGTGYGGPLTLELHPRGWPRSDDIGEIAALVARSVEYLRAISG